MLAAYICHPYSDNPLQNRLDVLNIVTKLHMYYSSYIFLAPHLYFPQFMANHTSEDYKKAMNACLGLLEKCDELWVFGSALSKGMRMELQLALDLGLEIHFHSTPSIAQQIDAAKSTMRKYATSLGKLVDK